MTFREALDVEAARVAAVQRRRVVNDRDAARARPFAYTGRSLYAAQIAEWRTFFPPDRFLVLSAEELHSAPTVVMKQVFRFIGLREDVPIRPQHLNARRYEDMAPDLRARLNDYFAPSVRSSRRRSDVVSVGTFSYDFPVGRLPDFYVIGAPKCGTSSLHAALDRHPQLFMSAVKEPKYFLGDDQPPRPSDGPDDAVHLARYVWRREDYEALFDDAPASSRCGESTPFYLGDPAALERLHKATPGARLIAVVRDPIDRAWSNWATNWPHREPIYDIVKACREESRRLAAGWEPYWGYVTHGLYGRGLRTVFELFPKEQVLVLRFEDLVTDADETLRRIHRFLGVDEYSDGGGIPVLNHSAVVPHDWLTRIESWATRKRWLADRIPAGVRSRLVVAERRRSVNPGPPASARRDLIPFFADDIRLTHELTGLDVLEWLHT
jgi:hypothetical protein